MRRGSKSALVIQHNTMPNDENLTIDLEYCTYEPKASFYSPCADPDNCMLQRGNADGESESNRKSPSKISAALPEPKPRMTAKFVPSLIVIPTCLSVASAVPLDGDFRGGGVSLLRRSRCVGEVEPPKQFPNRCFSRASSIEDSLFTSGKMKTATSPRPLQHKTTRHTTSKSVFTRENRSSRRRKSRSRSRAARKYRVWCERPSTFLNPIQDSKLLFHLLK